MHKITKTLLLILFFSNLIFSQDLTGVWTGEIIQRGKKDIILYSMNLEQEGDKVFGTSTSTAGGQTAKFEVGGIWDGKMLTIQEVRQLLPEGAKWCLKHMQMTGKYINRTIVLRGEWEAEGCTPGKIVLSRLLTIDDPKAGSLAEPVSMTEEKHEYPFPAMGKFVGSLAQNDRDYGFFFELNLNPDGTGTSKIHSDGDGGNAIIDLEWTFDKDNNILSLKETSIQSKSVEDWRWCIKHASLALDKDQNKFTLSGKWQGHIEGYTMKNGPCAPGNLFLEQPILQTKVKLDVESESGIKLDTVMYQDVSGYSNVHKRKVEVDRVLEVKNKTIRVKVWDNGTVDGDILSLFINGEMILEKHRVTRRKHETIVKLEKPTNYLILHAINLGSISPNTVAVSVDDGTKEQVVIMSSNLSKSGAIMIRQFSVND